MLHNGMWCEVCASSQFIFIFEVVFSIKSPILAVSKNVVEAFFLSSSKHQKVLSESQNKFQMKLLLKMCTSSIYLDIADKKLYAGISM